MPSVPRTVFEVVVSDCIHCWCFGGGQHCALLCAPCACRCASVLKVYLDISDYTLCTMNVVVLFFYCVRIYSYVMVDLFFSIYSFLFFSAFFKL